ncbi:MAG: YggU family protein [Zetaproteobacteria bacterium]|nr:YggU family protein [Zetaproteobacteria bacterium]
MVLPEGLIVTSADGIYLRVHVQPGAKRVQVCGIHGDALKIAVNEAPQQGRANDAVIAFMAKTLGLRKGDIAVVSGHTSRSKRLLVREISEVDLLCILAPIVRDERAS